MDYRQIFPLNTQDNALEGTCVCPARLSHFQIVELISTSNVSPLGTSVIYIHSYTSFLEYFLNIPTFSFFEEVK